MLMILRVIKTGKEFLGYLSDCQIIRKTYVPWLHALTFKTIVIFSPYTPFFMNKKKQVRGTNSSLCLFLIKKLKTTRGFS
jgi:hypothetical protein